MAPEARSCAGWVSSVARSGPGRGPTRYQLPPGFGCAVWVDRQVGSLPVGCMRICSGLDRTAGRGAAGHCHGAGGSERRRMFSRARKQGDQSVAEDRSERNHMQHCKLGLSQNAARQLVVDPSPQLGDGSLLQTKKDWDEPKLLRSIRIWTPLCSLSIDRERRGVYISLYLVIYPARQPQLESPGLIKWWR